MYLYIPTRKDLILKTIVCSNEKVLFTDIAGTTLSRL
jgi:hypothetical protein